MRAAVYSNTFTAMLGDAGNAYRRKGAPDEASLRRGVDVLRRVPFGILEAVTCVESQPIQDTFNLSVSERIFWGSLSSRRELGERIRTVQESWETSSI